MPRFEIHRADDGSYGVHDNQLDKWVVDGESMAVASAVLWRLGGRVGACLFQGEYTESDEVADAYLDANP